LKKILLFSDTHSYLGEDVKSHLRNADEIWHAGDIGSLELLDEISSFENTLRVVYGNIDDKEIRNKTTLNQEFSVEGVNVFMTHIGGYPNRYTKRVSKILQASKPDLYICGHSHILKVMKDQELGILHMNPGACGVVGFHKFRTLLSFELNNGKIENLNAIELGLRSAIVL
jgi:putative phosphoesterase